MSNYMNLYPMWLKITQSELEARGIEWADAQDMPLETLYKIGYFPSDVANLWLHENLTSTQKYVEMAGSELLN